MVKPRGQAGQQRRRLGRYEECFHGLGPQACAVKALAAGLGGCSQRVLSAPHAPRLDARVALQPTRRPVQQGVDLRGRLHGVGQANRDGPQPAAHGASNRSRLRRRGNVRFVLGWWVKPRA